MKDFFRDMTAAEWLIVAGCVAMIGLGALL